MKCHLCDREGSIFLTKFVNNTLKQVCYCVECAQKEGLLNSELMSLPKEILELFPDEEKENLLFSAKSLQECPHCHFTLEDWKLTHKLGCSYCYEVFLPDIMIHVSEIQPGSLHKGKSPVCGKNREQTLRSIARLKERLSAALEQENYEEAALIRDELAPLLSDDCVSCR